MTTEPTVVDDVTNARFIYQDGDADAVLSYRVHGDRLILTHTEVSESFRGRGIAAHLVRAAVERAELSGETVVPWCPYARKWLREHPEVTAQISIDWKDPSAL